MRLTLRLRESGRLNMYGCPTSSNWAMCVLPNNTHRNVPINEEMPISKDSGLWSESIVFKFPPKTCCTEKVLIVFPSRRRLVWLQSSKRSLFAPSIPFPSYYSQFSPYIRQVRVKLTACGLHVVHLNSFGDSPKEFKQITNCLTDYSFTYIV